MHCRIAPRVERFALVIVIASLFGKLDAHFSRNALISRRRRETAALDEFIGQLDAGAAVAGLLSRPDQ